VSGIGTNYTFAGPTVGTLGTPSPKTILVGREADVPTGPLGYRPELDILSVDFEETATEVGFIVKVASLPAAPTHGFDMEFAFGGVVYESWYNAYGGQLRDAAGGYCVDEACNTWKDTTVDVQFTPGSPGTIRAVMPWSETLGPQKGALLTLASVDLGDFTAYTSQNPAPGVYAQARSNGFWDTVYHSEPYYLLTGA
jgi:hypothetical protein